MDFKRKIVGAGFSGLDIIKAEYDYILPGGTCANVLTVLASMGWSASLLKAHYDDPWNSYVNSSLNKIGVEIVEYKNSQYAVPRVIQVNTAGCHFYYTVCPKCNKKLLLIDLPTKNITKRIESEIKESNFLFYDRISSGIKSMIDIASSNSVWAFYEPNSSRSYRQLCNNAAAADIVKFSAERISLKIGTTLKEELSSINHKTKLIITTLGNKGVAYTLKDENHQFSEWYSIDAVSIANTGDTSGAGDWLTAGFINAFSEYYPNVTSKISHKNVLESMQNGVQASKKGCEYLGALGGVLEKVKPDIVTNGICQYCLS